MNGRAFIASLWLAVALPACGAGSATTGPERQDAAIVWRGARVEGVRPADAEPSLERAWVQSVEPRFPGRTLAGWRIVMHEAPIPAPEDTRCGDRTCKPGEPLSGLTDPNADEIHLSWAAGAALWTKAAWEFCNALRPDRRDRGCA